MAVSTSKHSSPGLWSLLERIGRAHWPVFVRGDRDWGTQANRARAEQEGLDYLFKLRLTARVKKLVERLMRGAEWTDAGQGWQGAESELRLSGWSRKRRVVVLRRRLAQQLAVVGDVDNALAAAHQPVNGVAGGGDGPSSAALDPRPRDFRTGTFEDAEAVRQDALIAVHDTVRRGRVVDPETERYPDGAVPNTIAKSRARTMAAARSDPWPLCPGARGPPFDRRRCLELEGEPLHPGANRRHRWCSGTPDSAGGVCAPGCGVLGQC